MRAVTGNCVLRMPPTSLTCSGIDDGGACAVTTVTAASETRAAHDHFMREILDQEVGGWGIPNSEFRILNYWFSADDAQQCRHLPGRCHSKNVACRCEGPNTCIPIGARFLLLDNLGEGALFFLTKLGETP